MVRERLLLRELLLLLRGLLSVRFPIHRRPAAIVEAASLALAVLLVAEEPLHRLGHLKGAGRRCWGSRRRRDGADVLLRRRPRRPRPRLVSNPGGCSG